jgi:hypothetical protein
LTQIINYISITSNFMDQQTVDAIQEIMKHIAILNDETGQLAVHYAILNERVDWLCKFFWLLVSGVFATLATNIWQLLKMHKK